MIEQEKQKEDTSEDLALVRAAFKRGESQLQDVIGLKIPRKRIIGTLNVNVDVRKLPRRRPHVTFQMDTEEEPS